MSEILLKASDAKASATQVTKAAADAEADFNSLKTSLGDLADSFRGQSATAFEEKYEEWATSAKSLIESLDGLGQFLNSAAETIENTDEQIASQLRG